MVYLQEVCVMDILKIVLMILFAIDCIALTAVSYTLLRAH